MMKWMGNYLGHANADDDVKNLIFPSLVPTEPSITREELRAIEAYYVAAAPQADPTGLSARSAASDNQAL